MAALSVIIPANDEEAHIGACLGALLAQEGVADGALDVVVAANGCTDATVAIARGFEPRFAARGWRLEVLDIPEGTARGRIRRAKKLLEEQLTALASDDSTLESTVSGLETWARGLRAQVLPKENG